MKLWFSQSCTRKHVPEKKIRKSKKLVVTTDYRGLKINEITPYKLKLSRDRITDERSKFKILNNSHPIFNYPNKIEKNDFNDWVQERGLYFPNSWSDKFETHIEFSDYDKITTKGGLLSASYGNGKIIYTGISFFRQLPAGVP